MLLFKLANDKFKVDIIISVAIAYAVGMDCTCHEQSRESAKKKFDSEVDAIGAFGLFTTNLVLSYKTYISLIKEAGK